MPSEASASEIYDGVIFKYGPVAQSVPYLKKTYDFNSVFKTEEEKEEFKTVMDAIKSRLTENNPNYFENFSTEVKSGDHLRVKAAIEQSHEDLKNTLIGLAEEQDPSLDNKNFTFALAVVAIAAAAVHNVSVITSVAAVAVATWVQLALSCQYHCKAYDLKFEMEVDSITNSLKAA